MKKALATLLALVMLLALAACGSGAATTPPGDPLRLSRPPPHVRVFRESSSSTASSASDKKSTWLCDKKTTLTVCTYDAVNNSFPAPSNDLEFWKWLEDYTNVHIEWQISPFANYTEVVSTRLSSRTDLADIIVTQDWDVTNSAGQNGIFIDLSKYWDTCFQNTQKYWDNDGTNYKARISNEDGSIYGIGGSVNPIEGHILFLYNTAWMKKLNAKVPETLDQFTDLLQKMKDAGDLNGNGQNDEVVFTASNPRNITSVMGPSFNLEQYGGWDDFVADKNGTVSNEYTSDNMKNYYTYLHDLYSKGLLDSEICSMSMDTLSEKIAADRVGVFAFYSSFATTYGALTSDGVKDPFGEHYTLGGPLSSQYNSTPYLIRRDVTDSLTAGISSSCADPELACRWLDTLVCSEDALRTRSYGFENEDWKYDASGKIELIMPTDGSAWNITSKGCGQIAMPHIQTEAMFTNAMQQYPWYLSEYENLRKNYEWRAPSVAKVASYTSSEKELLDTCRTDIRSYWTESEDKFVKGELALASDWNTYVSSMGKLGMDSFTKAEQSIYDRTKK